MPVVQEFCGGLGVCYTVAMDYRLLDSGNRNKLEKVGPYTLIRPAAQAIWAPKAAHLWSQADAVYERDASGSGTWEWRRQTKREFDILYSDLAMRIRLTDFGHLGLFPEQAENWQWLKDVIRDRMKTHGANIHVLNLFAYTGGSTLAASQAGAHVVHLDAAKGVVDWARENAKLSHLDSRPIRWIVDDAIKFVEREVRRGHKYQGIILDPPSFGRGPKGQVFKIENQLSTLLEGCHQLLDSRALFVLYSGHTPGFTPLVMHNQLEELVGKRQGLLVCGEMTVDDKQGRQLPSGTYARWQAAS